MKRIYRSILLLAAALPAAFPTEAVKSSISTATGVLRWTTTGRTANRPSTTAVGNGSTCRTTGASQALTTNGIRADRKAASAVRNRLVQAFLRSPRRFRRKPRFRPFRRRLHEIPGMDQRPHGRRIPERVQFVRIRHHPFRPPRYAERARRPRRTFVATRVALVHRIGLYRTFT